MREFGIWIGLLLITLIVRYPDFNTLLINWDESMYLLVGRDLRNGNLPYVNYWVMKPPLAFVPYALGSLIAGKSIVGMRIFASFYISLAAYLLYRATSKEIGRSLGLLTAILLVVMSTNILSGRAFMTEHIALLPLAWIALQLASREIYLWKMALALGLCVMIRTNLVILLPAAIWLYDRQQQKKGRSRGRFDAALRMTLMTAVPTVVIALIYGLSGHFELFYKINFTLTAEFAGHNHVTTKMISRLSYLFAWRNVACVIAVMIYYIHIKSGLAPHKKWLQNNLLFMGFTLLSILVTGDRYAHYNIQILPFLLPILVYGFCDMFGKWKTHPALMFICTLVMLFQPSNLQRTKEAIEYQAQTGNFIGDRNKLYQVSEYIEPRYIPGRSIFAGTYPLLNYLIGADMPVSAVNPNSFVYEDSLRIIMGDDYSSDKIAQDIIAAKPQFIILSTRVPFFPELTPYMDKYYKLVKEISPLTIYEYQNGQ